MDYMISVILFISIIAIIFFGAPKVINYLLLRKLKDVPEIARKLKAGEYNSFNATRAQFFLDYLEARKLYFPKESDVK